MDAGLGGQQRDVAGGDVGDVGEEDVDPAAQGAGEGVEEVAFVHVAQLADVAPGAPHGGGFDVAGVQFGGVGRGGEGGAERSGAAAEVDDDGPGGREGGGLHHEELRTAAGHEDAGVHGVPASAELGPAQRVFERQPGGAARDERGQDGGGRGGLVQQPGLVLGEDAAGAAEGEDGGGEGAFRVNGHTSEAFRENRWALGDGPSPFGRLLSLLPWPPVLRRDRGG